MSNSNDGHAACANNRPLRVLSLFAGIGGLDLGLHAHGCVTTYYSEVDEYASAVMAARFPAAYNLGDITQIGFWRNAYGAVGTSKGTLENVDIICGGFPCQDISLAGKGAGIDGERSGLWRYYADAIRALRPRGVLVENVAALTSRGLDRVLGDLATCGYDAEWDCVPAAAVGAPHLRDRIFVVAYRSDATRDDAHSDGDRCGEQPSRERRAAQGVGVEQGHDPARLRGSDERRSAGADAAGERRREGRARRAPALDEVGDASGRPVADERRPTDDAMRRRHRAPKGQVRPRWDRPVGSDWWRVEPAMERVAHGVPDRVDRLRCLGNAVVPQVAAHVAGILLDRIGDIPHAA